MACKIVIANGALDDGCMQAHKGMHVSIRRQSPPLRPKTRHCKPAVTQCSDSCEVCCFVHAQAADTSTSRWHLSDVVWWTVQGSVTVLTASLMP